MRTAGRSLHLTNNLLKLLLKSNFYRRHSSLYPLHNSVLYATAIYVRQIRMYSEEENYFRGPPKRKNFVRRFIDNIKEGMQTKEFQSDLKGLEEETQKLRESKILLTMQEHLKNSKEFADKSIKSGSKFVGEKSEFMRTASAEAFEKIKSSKGAEMSKEYASKIKQSASVAQEKISDQAKKVQETEAYKKVSTGVNIVREDLIDDILSESAPYKHPDSVRKRTDPSTYQKSVNIERVPVDEQTTSVTLTKQSVYQEKIAKFLRDNPVVNFFTNYKMKYDESDNLVIRGARTVTENIGDFFKSSFSQSDMIKVMTAIQSVEPRFTMEEFILQCQHDIIPNVLEAFLKGNLEVLKTWCHEAAFNVLSAYFKQNYTDVKEARILEIYNTDVLTAKMLDSIPVLFLMFDVQQVLTKFKGETRTEQLEKVRYIWALSRDLENYDPTSSWRVLEFSIHETKPLLI